MDAMSGKQSRNSRLSSRERKKLNCSKKQTADGAAGTCEVPAETEYWHLNRSEIHEGVLASEGDNHA